MSPRINQGAISVTRMGKATGFVSTVVMLAVPVTAAAQVKAGEAASKSGVVQAPTPSPAPAASATPAVSTEAAPSSGAAPGAADSMPPVPGSAAVPPAAPPTAADVAPLPVEGQAGAADDATDRAEPRRTHRRGRRHHGREERDDQDAEEDEEENVSGGPAPWHLRSTRFILSAERLTSALSWNTVVKQSVTIPSPSGSSASTTIDEEVETSGVDVSFLGAGGGPNVHGMPRIGFDAMFSNGFTLGGALSYITTSGKSEISSGSAKLSMDGPTTAMFTLAGRLGIMIEASPIVGIWLRGGFTRISVASEYQSTTTTPGNSFGPTTTTKTTTDTVATSALTLDPQLVLTPIPHVGITLGLALDVGLGGTTESSSTAPSSSSSSGPSVGSQSPPSDTTRSSYGITGGLVALF